MQMPDMDGEEVLKEIKLDPDLRNIPVIILTSMGHRGDAAHMESVGCAAYLLKPVRQKELFNAILAVLGRQNQPHKEQAGSIITRHVLAETERGINCILLAEDNPINQKLALRLLQKVGYSVDIVETGQQAIDAVQKKQYQLVLMDVQMPDMDGLDATQHIRALSGEVAKIPIVAMTAHAMSDDREKCLQAGMNDYLSKPLNVDEMLKMVKKYIAQSRQEENSSPVDTSSDGQERNKLPLYNLKAALPRFGDDKDTFYEFMGAFITHLKKSVYELETAINNRDTEKAHFLSHSIKGAAANFEIYSVRDAAFEIEKQTKDGKLDDADILLGKIKGAIPLLEKDYLQNFPAADKKLQI